jgi:mannosyl-oligosaccharide alpha-1,2-mannosidase
MWITSTVACLVLSLSQQTLSIPLNENSQKRKITYKVDHYRANAVKEAFQYAWDGYYKYAWTHDELHPVAKSFGDSRLAIF